MPNECKIERRSPKVFDEFTTFFLKVKASKALLASTIFGHIFQNPTFYPEINKNLMFEKSEFCEKGVLKMIILGKRIL